MDKLKINNGIPVAPDHITIPYITGDGVGIEITPACLDVVNAAVQRAYRGSRSINWKEVQAGEASFRKSGKWLPDATLDTFKEYLIGIKGPLTTPVGEGARSINVALRQLLDLYVCQRPVRWFKGVFSPLKDPQKVNMIVFRENTEDIYAGIEWDKDTPEAKKFLDFLRNEMGVTKIRFPGSSAFGVKPVSEEGTKRLVRAAVQYAVTRQLPSLTFVHKGNIMKFTEGGFRRWAYEVAEQEFGDSIFSMQVYEQVAETQGKEAAEQMLQEAKSQKKTIVKDVIADAFLQNTLLKPEDYSAIATLNLNGDYISDQLAAMVGGIGIAPGANINYITGHAIFEATHGTAPDIAGQNRANPSSLILSAAMMLDYIRWNEAADLIVRAMERCFTEGIATADLSAFMPKGQYLTTSRFRQSLIAHINSTKYKRS
ncbi:MAG: NADP-dependent isocitrate dehydrogenase [Tannerella sp.]|jgi:isocitrate dehydrogenase|nr:NADP-dependent isocitrate dehydrogenase [Tannerella sp.]